MRLELKVLRTKSNLTQNQMADRLGVTRVNYLLIENGKSNGTLKFWDRLQSEFGLTPKKLDQIRKNK